MAISNLTRQKHCQKFEVDLTRERKLILKRGFFFLLVINFDI